MGSSEVSETNSVLEGNEAPVAQMGLASASKISPQACPNCGGNNGSAGGFVTPTYVYAIGRVEPRFPRPSVEKEFAQVLARGDSPEPHQRKALQSVLSKPENRYLVRQMCWVMTIGGLETYVIVPRDPSDWNLLVETLRPSAGATDVDIVIGMKGPIAPTEMCNGLMVPVVAFDQIYSFDRDTLIKSIPKTLEKSKKESAKAQDQFDRAAEEVFERILQMTDNAGATDEHRALNYLAVRYHAIYTRTAEAFEANAALSAVEVRSSGLSGTRRVVDVIFSYTDRGTDVVEKSFVRVDVTEEFPFLVSKMAPYFDRS